MKNLNKISYTSIPWITWGDWVMKSMKLFIPTCPSESVNYDDDDERPEWDWLKKK